MIDQAAAEAEPMGLQLPFAAESARIARERLTEWLDHLGRDEQRDDARLILSELVGNSVRHAKPLADGTVRIALHHGEDVIDIAVTDGGAVTTPERVNASVSDLAGRGLAIVESLAARWWVESTRSRTTVHAILPID